VSAGCHGARESADAAIGIATASLGEVLAELKP
jgi:hypothetical protein